MTALFRAHGAAPMSSSRTAGHRAMLALMAVVLLGVAAALATIGLDALNDVLVRGFASLPGSAN